MPKNIVLKLHLLFSSLILSMLVQGQQFYSIPAQQFDPMQVMGKSPDADAKESFYPISFESVTISEQILWRDYKLYLAAVRRDSGEIFYQSQLPDSSIGNFTNYLRYLTDTNFLRFPAVGISAESAMNYCRWKTRIDADGSFTYRLPLMSEWLCAYRYLDSSKRSHDFSTNYADWTSCLYFEGGSSSNFLFYYDAHMPFVASDPVRLKRYRVIGNCYLYQRESLAAGQGVYYTFRGYRHVGFRMVKAGKKINTGIILERK